jgi:uncharacterized membrane protein
MTTIARLDGRLGYAMGAVGAVLGLAAGSGETAVLAAVIAFFLGKSITSTLRVFAG